MGRNFFISGFRDKDPRGGRDLYVDLEMQMRQEGERHQGAENLPLEQRPIMEPAYVTGKDGKPIPNPRAGQQAIHPITGKPRTRPVRANSGLGFASEDFHYAGDRIVNLGEEIEVKGGKPTGDLLFRFQRIDDQGRSKGTYEQRWTKDGETRMRSTGKARRYYSFGGGK